MLPGAVSNPATAERPSGNGDIPLPERQEIEMNELTVIATVLTLAAAVTGAGAVRAEDATTTTKRGP